MNSYLQSKHIPVCIYNIDIYTLYKDAYKYLYIHVYTARRTYTTIYRNLFHHLNI